jgi:hypothetical protein
MFLEESSFRQNLHDKPNFLRLIHFQFIRHSIYFSLKQTYIPG